MATNIRRSLFIGLGGTGINAIVNTKKMFLDTYGEVPPMVGFLGIDTDLGEFDKQKAILRNGKVVTLDKNEQVSISVKDPNPLYDKNKNYLGWFPEENARALIVMTDGAGQVRSNGRFAFWVNHKNVKAAIQNKLTDITKLEIMENEQYTVIGNGAPVIHMVFSICGGTGCGTFTNVAYLIREHFPQCELNGYAVLPGVFTAMNEQKIPNARPNAYGSIEDLDWLMSHSLADEKFDIINLNAQFTTGMTPFDTVKLIDNENAHGDSVNHINDLCAMLGLTLATLSGDTQTGVNSDLNNLKVRMYSKNYDIGDKVAWASGMGMCEITVNNRELGRLYALKAAQQIIDQLLQATGDATKSATQWINDMQIRENEGYDQVVDFMLSKSPRQSMPEILNTKAPHAEVMDWLNKVAYESAEVKNYPSRVTELSSKVLTNLSELANDYMQKNGVQSAKNLLVAIAEQINTCYEEMTTELADHKERQSVIEGTLKTAENVLAGYKKSFWGKNLTDEYKNNVNSAALKVAINYREIIRREAAINFYSKLLAQLSALQTTVGDIANRLEELRNKFEKMKAETLFAINSKKPMFQIDLTKNYVDRVVVDDQTLTSYFLDKHNLMAMADQSEDELIHRFIDYTLALDQCREWAAITINQVYEEMSPAEQRRTLAEAIQKSSPLLGYRIESQGLLPLMQPDDTFVVGVYDHRNSPIKMDDIKQFVTDPNSRPEFCSTGSKTSIVIYRMVGPMPPCVLDDMNTCKDAAERSGWNVHFDAIIQARMKREGWSIFPQEGSNDALELWVKGLMFHLIRNEKGRYQYKDFNETSRALDDYWVDIDHPKQGDRATAFQLFKQKMNDPKIHDTFAAEVEKCFLEMGQAKYSELVKVVKGKDYYYDHVSQINLQRETLNGVGYDGIKKQIISEVDFVMRDL